MSFHGMDVGLVYNLPKNVRVFMYCFAGKPVDAADWNEALTWYVATMDESKYDKHGKFMKRLTLTLDSDKKNSKCAQYCVFSGNLAKYDLNRIPDLFLEDEDTSFKTGLFNLPAKFDRLFLKDKYSSVDDKFYKPGDKGSINIETLHKKIKPFTKKNKDLPYDGFLAYFVNPGSFKYKFKDLDFVVIPKSRNYNSYIDLCRKTNKPILDINIKKERKDKMDKKEPIKLKESSFRVPLRNSKDTPIEKYQYDVSIPNTHIPKEKEKVLKLETKNKGLYLSDVIRYLCNKNPDTFITLIVSSCRVFEDGIPKNVMNNQKKTATVSTNEYLKKYSKEDVK
ncbi:hypothetical protein CPAV1605_187 [seawater metagenome]|uniref:Uncharacterized protein n=1 Tax=seawater metagenome TaxID=1561972 RepID=A0A5E8CKX3_9ZZZZ